MKKSILKIVIPASVCAVIAAVIILVIVPMVVKRTGRSKSGFDGYEKIAVTFIVRIDMSSEEGQAYAAMINETPAERIEEIKEELEEENDEDTRKLLQKELDDLASIANGPVIGDDHILEIPLMGVEIKRGSVDEFCDANGTIEVTPEQAEELLKEYKEPEYEVQIDEDKIRFTRVLTFLEFAEGAANAMGGDYGEDDGE